MAQIDGDVKGAERQARRSARKYPASARANPALRREKKSNATTLSTRPVCRAQSTFQVAQTRVISDPGKAFPQLLQRAQAEDEIADMRHLQHETAAGRRNSRCSDARAGSSTTVADMAARDAPRLRRINSIALLGDARRGRDIEPQMPAQPLP